MVVTSLAENLSELEKHSGRSENQISVLGCFFSRYSTWNWIVAIDGQIIIMMRAKQHKCDDAVDQPDYSNGRQNHPQALEMC